MTGESPSYGPRYGVPQRPPPAQPLRQSGTAARISRVGTSNLADDEWHHTTPIYRRKGIAKLKRCTHCSRLGGQCWRYLASTGCAARAVCDDCRVATLESAVRRRFRLPRGEDVRRVRNDRRPEVGRRRQSGTCVTKVSFRRRSCEMSHTTSLTRCAYRTAAVSTASSVLSSASTGASTPTMTR